MLKRRDVVVFYKPNFFTRTYQDVKTGVINGSRPLATPHRMWTLENFLKTPLLKWYPATIPPAKSGTYVALTDAGNIFDMFYDTELKEWNPGHSIGVQQWAEIPKSW